MGKQTVVVAIDVCECSMWHNSRGCLGAAVWRGMQGDSHSYRCPTCGHICRVAELFPGEDVAGLLQYAARQLDLVGSKHEGDKLRAAADAMGGENSDG